MLLLSKRTDGGFTLFELLVVIALMALAAAVGSLWLPDVADRVAIDHATTLVERELSQAAEAARQTGQDQSVRLDTEGGTLSLQVDQRVVALRHGIAATWVAAAEAGSHGRLGLIVFFATGGASGGRLELRRNAARSVIVVDWLTGDVRSAEGSPQ